MSTRIAVSSVSIYGMLYVVSWYVGQIGYRMGFADALQLHAQQLRKEKLATVASKPAALSAPAMNDGGGSDASNAPIFM